MALPTDQDIARAVEREPIKVSVLAAGALIGGFALGAAFTESMRRGWIEERPEELTTPQAWGDWIAANVGLILAGASMREAIVDMGRDEFLKTMGLFSGAVVVLKVVNDTIRKTREK